MHPDLIMTQQPLKVLTLNCNRLNDKIKAKCVLFVLLKSQADIIYLQETHWRNANL